VSRVLSVRVKDDEAKFLERLARQLSRSVGATASLLLREKLREEAFPLIEFRSSAVGRQAYVKGHRVTVWQVLWLAREFDMDAHRVAEHLQWGEEPVQEALAYARAYPEEIEPILDEVESTTFEDLKRRVPWIREAPA
jgi:uncharacterized protein (DUF433 family)